MVERRRADADRSGLAVLDPATRAAVVEAVWQETRAARTSIHRQARRDRCDLTLRCGPIVLQAGGPGSTRGTAAGLVVAGDCPCRDHVVDILVGADSFLSGRIVSNPAGAVRRHVRTRLSGDWIRERRAATGAQTRVDRIRDGERARSLPGEFHRALLEYLADEAGSAAPLEDEDQLERRLADRAAEEFGGTGNERLPEVRAALPAVRSAGRSGRSCRASDGGMTTWWDRYIDEPLGRRPRLSLLRLDGPDDVRDRAAPTTRDPDDESHDAVVRAFGALVVDDDLVRGVHRTLVELVDQGLVPTAVAARLLRDQQRIALVVDVVRSLATDQRNRRELTAPGPGD